MPDDSAPEALEGILAELAGAFFGSSGDFAPLRRASQPSPDDPRRMEFRYRALVEQIPAVTFMASLDGGVNEIYVSPQVETLLGYTQQEWLSDPVLWYQRLHHDDRDTWNREFARGCLSGGPFRAECRFIARDGHVVWVHGEARLIRDERNRPLWLQGVAFDITESKVAEEKVRASLREKEVLLKEIHHRVKNNLQITSSLLKLQSKNVKDPVALAMLRDSQDRIRSMALVHEKLYQSADLSRVDFAGYVRSLASSLVRSYGPQAAGIALETEIVDVQLAVDVAVPCGLILNELISNTFKHAFPQGGPGKLRITLHGNEPWYELTVSDNGIGLPAGFDARASRSLGLQLIVTLTDQLDGTLSIDGQSGTTVKIRFRNE